MNKEDLEASLQILDRWTLFFIALVAIGVVGEFVTHFLYSRSNKRLVSLLHEEEQHRLGEIARLDPESAIAKEGAAEAIRVAEQERLKRVQLQRSVLHRMIPQIGEGNKTNWDSLKPFKGVDVIFLYTPEREPEMFSGNLVAFVLNAGWNFLGSHAIKENEIPEGVTVEAYVGSHGETDISTKAAESFPEFLKANQIEKVRVVPAKPGRLSPNTVEVRIGKFPDPFK